MGNSSAFSLKNVEQIKGYCFQPCYLHGPSFVLVFDRLVHSFYLNIEPSTWSTTFEGLRELRYHCYLIGLKRRRTCLLVRFFASFPFASLPPCHPPLCLIPVCRFSLCLLPPILPIHICHGMIQHKGHWKIERHEVLLRGSLAFDKPAFLTNMRARDVFARPKLIPASKVRALGII